MSAIWDIDPALAGPPLSADARAASRQAWRERHNATVARIDKQIKANEAETLAKAAAWSWLRSTTLPLSVQETMPPALRDYLSQ